MNQPNYAHPSGHEQMDTEKLRELEQAEGAYWDTQMDCPMLGRDLPAPRYVPLYRLAAQPPKAEAEVEVFVDSLGCQRSRVRWADGELDPPPRLAHGTKLYTATPTAAADSEDAARYRKLKPMLLSADFEPENYVGLTFALPVGTCVMANLDSILDGIDDAARNQEAGRG